MDEELKKKIDYIKAWVHKYREVYNIKPTPGIKHELSCIAYGEGYNLLYNQLIPTVDGDGAWNELNSKEVVDLVLNEIKSYELRKGKLLK